MFKPERWLRPNEHLYRAQRREVKTKRVLPNCAYCSMSIDGKPHGAKGHLFCNEFCCDAFVDYGPQSK
jgi:hypothetical protein